MYSIFRILLIFCIQLNLYAANSGSIFPLHSSGSLRFDVDVCQMDGAADSTRIEIIYSIFLSKENLVASTEENTTTLSIDLGIHNKSGQLLAKITESKSVSLYDSLNQNSYTTFMDIKKFSILPDTVTLDLKIQESLMGLQGDVSKSFQVRPFKKEFSLSDLYFASHAQRATANSAFNKGGLMLIPNPSRLFFVSGDAPKIFAYYEINNLTYDINTPTFYEVNAVVQDMSGKAMFNDPRKQIKVTSENTSRIKVVPIGELKNGVYHLSIEVVDIASGLRQEADGYFKVDRGENRTANLLPMSEVEAQKYFDQIKYIATDQEKEIYNKLDPRGKQEFLFHFWKSRDPDPGTPQNEFMIEHFRRMDVAEQRFKGGINSDMGRVYIMYGPPEDIERENLMIIGAQSIETWVYTLNGRSDFVFIDRDGDRKYKLIHSTHRDEFSNPDWRDQISTWVDQ